MSAPLSEHLDRRLCESATTLTDDQHRSYSSHDDPVVRGRRAERVDLPACLLTERIRVEARPSVLRRYAKHPNTTGDDLVTLAGNADYQVVREALANPNFPDDRFDLDQLGGDVDVTMTLADLAGLD